MIPPVRLSPPAGPAPAPLHREVAALAGLHPDRRLKYLAALPGPARAALQTLLDYHPERWSAAARGVLAGRPRN